MNDLGPWGSDEDVRAGDRIERGGTAWVVVRHVEAHPMRWSTGCSSSRYSMVE